MEDKPDNSLNLESLINIAQMAGFSNFHSSKALTTNLFGRIFSDKHEIIYIRKMDEKDVVKREDRRRSINHADVGDIELFGFSEPYDFSNCSLYRFEENNPVTFFEIRSELSDRTYIVLESRCPAYSGIRAVEYIRRYIK